MKIGDKLVYSIPKEQADNIADLGLKVLSDEGSLDMSLSLKLMYEKAVSIKQTLEQTYQNFLNWQGSQKRIINKQQKWNLQKEQDKPVPNLNEILRPTKKEIIENKYSSDLIQIMKKALMFLEEVRFFFTGQRINTTFTIYTKEGMIIADKSAIPHNLVLSTYGVNANNIISLAYEISETIEEITKKAKVDDSRTKIYSHIMKLKEPYLKKYKNPNRKYKPYFNSKDAEILDLYSQLGEKSLDNLTVSRYAYLRSVTGGGGGYRTSQLQLGDIGLTQDKFFSTKKSKVNYASYNYIKNGLTKLINTLSQSKNINELKQRLLNQFTEKKKHISDSISWVANNEAKKNINNLFKDFNLDNLSFRLKI